MEKKSRYTEAQRKSTKKYLDNHGTFKVIVSKEKKQAYQAAAQASGVSLNQFAEAALDEKIDRDGMARNAGKVSSADVDPTV